MEELIFFAVIIFFSIVESIARSKKARQKQQDGEAEPAQFEWAQKAPWEEAEELPTYDDEPSYDDEYEDDDGIPGEPLERYKRPHGTAARPEPVRPPQPQRASREEAAAQILAELQKLGLNLPQQEEARTRPLPKQSPPIPLPEPEPASVERSRASTVSRSRVSDRTRSVTPAVREVHRAHASYGTDPSERPPSEQDGMDPLAEELSRDAAAVRSQLLSDNASALRQAIILQEVLAPPVAMRGDG